MKGKQELQGLVPAGLGGNQRQSGAIAFDSDLVLFYTGQVPSGLFCTLHNPFHPRPFSRPEGLYIESSYLD